MTINNQNYDERCPTCGSPHLAVEVWLDRVMQFRCLKCHALTREIDMRRRVESKEGD